MKKSVGITYDPFTKASMISSSRVSGTCSRGAGCLPWAMEEGTDSASTSKFEEFIAEARNCIFSESGYGGGRESSERVEAFGLIEEMISSNRGWEAILYELHERVHERVRDPIYHETTAIFVVGKQRKLRITRYLHRGNAGTQLYLSISRNQSSTTNVDRSRTKASCESHVMGSITGANNSGPASSVCCRY